MAPAAATESPSTASQSTDGGATPGGAGAGLTEVLARKAKQAEVEAFKAALPRAHPIFTELDKVSKKERPVAEGEGGGLGLKAGVRRARLSEMCVDQTLSAIVIP